MATTIMTLTSCSFRVKDIAAFKAWFERYQFGYDVQLCVDANGYASFAGEESCAFPRMIDEDGNVQDVPDLATFSRELCEHLLDGELVNIVACGHEDYRYSFFDQLIIAKAYPDRPIYRCGTSDLDYEGCMRLIEAEAAKALPPAPAPTVFVAIRGGCFEGASSTDPSTRVIVEDFDNPDLDGNTQPYEDGVGELDAETLQELLVRCK
jgi:hypothetical protein